MPADRPLRQRRVGPLIALTIAAMLGAGLLLVGRRDVDAQRGLGTFTALLSAIAVVILWQRSRQISSERRGWRLLALAMVFSLSSSGALALLARPFHTGGPVTWIYLIFNLPFHVLSAAGLLSFPWRHASGRSRWMQASGSLLFVGSLLLLLLLAGSWSTALRHPYVINALFLGGCVRISVVGGVALYILAEDARRGRGPLGWQAAAVLVIGFIAALLQNLAAASNRIPLPLFAIVSAHPFFSMISAWSRQPVEPSAPLPARDRGLGLFIYVPYMVDGVGLGAYQLRDLDSLSGLTVVFVALTAVLVFRQFLLLREVGRSRDTLEARVKERTHDLETAQAALIRTERMNAAATLGAGIAHDLNNALCIIQNSTDVLRQERDLGRPPDPGALDDMQTAARQAAALTGRLLRFARQEIEEPSLVDLPSTVNDLDGLLRMVLSRRIALAMEVEPVAMTIRSARSRVEQILVNLVANARDAVAPGGRVAVRLHRVLGAEGPSAHLEVADDGAGMGSEVKAHLFELFFTTKGEGRGTGLGLVSVKALVESDGGRILVDSAPGRGTTVTLRYPLVEMAETA